MTSVRLGKLGGMDGQALIGQAGRTAGLVVFCAIGLFCIVAGGLVAAVTGPLRLEHGSWAAAYLVLVGGVAQSTLGAGQYVLAPRLPARWVAGVELAAWNGGSVAVIGGTVLVNPWIVDFGGLLLVVALAFMIGVTRGSTPDSRWLIWVYRTVLATIVISIPIGLMLAHLRGT